MRRTLQRRWLALALAVALGAVGPACRDEAGREAGADPVQRLSQLLRRGAQPGELTVEERAEVERLLVPLLPPTEGALAGYRWRVAYDDLPEADFVSLDLLEGPGDTAPRALWCHLFWRGEAAAAERARFTRELGPWPARGVDDHHLFVRVGTVELRAVADRDDFRSTERIEEVLEAFDLDALSRL
jgi:hypothetical protein